MNKRLMVKLGFKKEVEEIQLGKCPLCAAKILVGSFRDELSRREFRISGMCQKCQDSTFC